EATKDEYPRANGSAVSEARQPFVDYPPADQGTGNEGHQDEYCELARQEVYESGYGRSHDFSYADLAGSLFPGERGEGKQSQSGNENGQAGENRENASEALFGTEQFVEVFVEKEVFKRFAGSVTLPKTFDLADETGRISVVTDGEVTTPIGKTYCQRPDLLLQRLKVEIPHDSDYSKALLLSFVQVKNLLLQWIVPAKLTGSRFIEDDGTGVGRKIAGEESSLYHLKAKNLCVFVVCKVLAHDIILIRIRRLEHGSIVDTREGVICKTRFLDARVAVDSVPESLTVIL